MKRIRHNSHCKKKLLHIETDLAIINILVGLHDEDDRRVEVVQVICNDYAGEPPARIEGEEHQKYQAARVVEMRGNP